MSAVQNLHWITAVFHKLKLIKENPYVLFLFYFLFFFYLTKLHAQWASERVQDFTANFCYVEYLCVLSRSRISELSKTELPLQNIKWLFKLLSHQFSLQEMELRLCHELPPSSHWGCGKTLGLRRRRWLLSVPTILGLCVDFFPWVLCAGLFLAVWWSEMSHALLSCMGFPAITAVALGGGAGLQLGHLQVEITLVISVPLCWASLTLGEQCLWTGLGWKGTEPKPHKGLVLVQASPAFAVCEYRHCWPRAGGDFWGSGGRAGGWVGLNCLWNGGRAAFLCFREWEPSSSLCPRTSSAGFSCMCTWDHHSLCPLPAAALVWAGCVTA